MASKRFRVAFTFAGEKRQFVSEVASILATRLGEDAILYDKFHEAEFARRRLAFYLPDLYHKNSDLIVVFVSTDYEQREWCGLEWDAVFDLIKRGEDESVMLFRFDYAQVRGLFSIAGFVDLDSKTPHQTAVLILQRLALNEGRHKDYYLQEIDRLNPPAYGPNTQNYTYFDPCRFDLEDFTEKTMETKRRRIDSRRQLAEESGLSLTAVRVKATKIRSQLHKCILKCLDEKARRFDVGPPV